MNKYKNGFTLLEVMIAIFIFSSGMLAFMAYHTRANMIMFDTESSQIAHAVALNLLEEIDGMLAIDFAKFADKEKNSGLVYDSIYLDANFLSFFGDNFKPGPFDAWGKPLGGDPSEPYMFYRMLKINTYNNITSTEHKTGTQYSRLRDVDVIVGWPMRGYGSVKCNSYGKAGCNYISISMVRPVD